MEVRHWDGPEMLRGHGGPSLPTFGFIQTYRPPPCRERS